MTFCISLTCIYISKTYTQNSYADLESRVYMENLGNSVDSKDIYEDSERLATFLEKNELNISKMSNVDYENAIKIYTDIDIKDNGETLYNHLEKQPYIWSVPVYQEKYRVEYSKSMPLNNNAKKLLNEDEIEFIKSSVGKYRFSNVKVYDKNLVDYRKIVDDKIKDLGLSTKNIKVRFLGGINNNRYLKAVIFIDYKPEYIIPFDLKTSSKSTMTYSYEVLNFKDYMLMLQNK